MPVVDVKNLEGQTVGQVDLADDVFGVKVNAHLLHETVRHYLAGKRAGTHKTKDKSEVSGSGRKLWKQKGTGRARIGSIRSPLWRHGGTVHGPVPRSYEYALPKKMTVGALRSALSAKLAEQKLTIVDGWSLESHKTKAFQATLGKLDRKMQTTLLVDNGANVNLERASRNLHGVTLVPSTLLGPYDLMRHDRLMLSREAALRLSRSLSAEKSDAPVQPGGELAPAVAVRPVSESRAKSDAPVKASASPKAAKAAGKSVAPKKKPAAEKKEKPKAKPEAKKE
jgi:large subunit ribosomal protein L4